MRWITRPVALLAIAAVLGAGIVADTVPPTSVPVVTALDASDPPPVRAGAAIGLGVGGGIADFGDAQVAVPPGSVAAGHRIDVEVGQAPGAYAGQVFGRPILVDHDVPLGAALDLRWTLPSLTRLQQAAVTLIRWDPAISAWRPTGQATTIAGDVLTASVQQFSWISWSSVADAGQFTGQLTGTRVNAPHCNGTGLPSWVRGTVDPDESAVAAAIRVCFEPDTRDEIVTTRIANNRTFTQRLTMTGGGEQWAWTWPGTDDPTPAGAVYNVAHAVLDSPTSLLLPPTHEEAVGIGRPDTPGEKVIAATAVVGPATILTDVVRYAFDRLPIGGLESPVANAFLQALFECGGKQLLSPDNRSVQNLLPVVVDAVGSCASELTRPSSEFGARFESLLQDAIRTLPQDAGRIVTANRVVHQIAHAFAVLQAGEFAFYLSDQMANAAVGPLTLSVRGDGRAQPLGQWTPTCTDVATDANRLYRNLALRDEFADRSKELWQFPTWQSSTRTAVRPLTRCPPAYLQALAGRLPGLWGDPKAGQVVAAEVLALVAAVASVPPGTWSRRGALLAIAAGGRATVEYQLGFGDCDASTPFVGQFCYFHANLAFTSGTGQAFKGRITKTWFTEGNIVDHSDYADQVPAVNSPVSVTIDAAADTALYRDSFGLRVLCGSNAAIRKPSGCS